MKNECRNNEIWENLGNLDLQYKILTLVEMSRLDVGAIGAMKRGLVRIKNRGRSNKLVRMGGLASMWHITCTRDLLAFGLQAYGSRCLFLLRLWVEIMGGVADERRVRST